MLNAIGNIENAYDCATTGLFSSIEEHALAFSVDHVSLFQESLLIQHPFVQPPGVFGQSVSAKRTYSPGQVYRVGQRVRNRHCRLAGIDAYGSYIQPEVR